MKSHLNAKQNRAFTSSLKDLKQGRHVLYQTLRVAFTVRLRKSQFHPDRNQATIDSCFVSMAIERTIHI